MGVAVALIMALGRTGDQSHTQLQALTGAGLVGPPVGLLANSLAARAHAAGITEQSWWRFISVIVLGAGLMYGLKQLVDAYQEFSSHGAGDQENDLPASSTDPLLPA